MQGDAFDLSKHRLQVSRWQFALKWLRKGKTFFYIYNLYNSVFVSVCFLRKSLTLLPKMVLNLLCSWPQTHGDPHVLLLDPRIIGMSHHTHLVPAFLFSNFFNVTSPQNIFLAMKRNEVLTYMTTYIGLENSNTSN